GWFPGRSSGQGTTTTIRKACGRAALRSSSTSRFPTSRRISWCSRLVIRSWHVPGARESPAPVFGAKRGLCFRLGFHLARCVLVGVDSDAQLRMQRGAAPLVAPTPPAGHAVAPPRFAAIPVIFVGAQSNEPVDGDADAPADRRQKPDPPRRH